MLVDTNVLVAAVVPDHPHHGPSSAFLSETDGLAVAAHSIAEFFSTVTRPGAYGWSPGATALQIEAMLSFMRPLSLSADQTIFAMRDFAAQGGRGAEIYDRLIGEVATVHALSTIVTWNVRHMRPLFPRLRVKTPDAPAEEF